MKVLVLKTSVSSKKDYHEIVPFLNSHPLICKWSIDLEDCDKVLRVVSNTLSEKDLTHFLSVLGVECSELVE